MGCGREEGEEGRGAVALALGMFTASELTSDAVRSHSQTPFSVTHRRLRIANRLRITKY